MRWYIIAVVCMCFAGPVAVQAEPMPECAELLKNRCQSCHYLERVCSEIGKKTKRKWKSTLKRMVKRRGAELNDEEQEFLLGCLLAPAPDVKKECEKE